MRTGGRREQALHARIRQPNHCPWARLSQTPAYRGPASAVSRETWRVTAELTGRRSAGRELERLSPRRITIARQAVRKDRLGIMDGGGRPGHRTTSAVHWTGVPLHRHSRRVHPRGSRRRSSSLVDGQAPDRLPRRPETLGGRKPGASQRFNQGRPGSRPRNKGRKVAQTVRFRVAREWRTTR